MNAAGGGRRAITVKGSIRIPSGTIGGHPFTADELVAGLGRIIAQHHIIESRLDDLIMSVDKRWVLLP